MKDSVCRPCPSENPASELGHSHTRELYSTNSPLLLDTEQLHWGRWGSSALLKGTSVIIVEGPLSVTHLLSPVVIPVFFCVCVFFKSSF